LVPTGAPAASAHGVQRLVLDAGSDGLKPIRPLADASRRH
jgi:hypothetical protein